MGKRQRQVTRPSNSRRENSKEIPIDLLIDIFSRLSMADIARCRCVSKLWSSVPRLRDFTELFLKISSARPRILFTFPHNGKRIFYSISQHLHSEPSPLPFVPYYHMSFPKGKDSSYDYEIHAPVRGFLCSKASKPMIYNPSTRECKTLPRAMTKRTEMKTYFGSEKFKSLVVELIFWCSTLINCKDASELRWSKTIYTLPFYWKNLVADNSLYIVGMTSAGEIVLSTCYLNYPFYIVYYNVVKKTAAKIEIQFGNIAKKAKSSRIYTFIDYVENVERMD
ncbi:F-box associated domain type 3 [Arabidopsis thaliana x Arabidopsis arenosa]|uniref:F-box associated domain type 3 n=1 Tax=Arabidopsis thaliana x Arabidopsis arenosa TaxID=1240361 RepID=A0A8T1ZP33_9BRAS|nr:F-box associated domain type 3 [Arabidopsis thaliana x Arabidopsis arenosa]